MKKSSWMKARPRLCAATGLAVGLLVTAGVTPASAQAANAADLCTPDVMRLCNDFIPDDPQIRSFQALVSLGFLRFGLTAIFWLGWSRYPLFIG